MKSGLMNFSRKGFNWWGIIFLIPFILSACTLGASDSKDDQETQSNVLETVVKSTGIPVDLMDFQDQTPVAIQPTEAYSEIDSIILAPETIAGLSLIGKLSDLDSENVELAFSPDSTLLAVATGSNYADVWDVNSQELAFILEEHTWPVVNVTFSPDGHTLYTSSSNGLINAWLYNRGYFSLDDQIFAGSEIFKTAISHNGEKLAACSADRWLRTWETQNYFLIFEKKHSSNCKTLEFSWDDQMLFASMRQGFLSVWADQGVEIEEIQKYVGESYLIGPEIFQDGNSLIVGDGNDIRLIHLKDGVFTQSISAHDEFITSLSLSPDGQILATAGLDRVVKIWDTETWDVLISLSEHSEKIEQVLFSPDGRYLATADRSGKILLWGLESLEN
jgi:WD40 repeat protein